MIRTTCLALAIVSLWSSAASAAEILIKDAGSQPENLAMAPNGDLFVGSASTPYVYVVRKGSTTATPFIDVSSETPNPTFLGVLTDGASNTLWTCQLQALPETPPRRVSSLRGFDLQTGAPKLRWSLPGNTSTCNDFSYGPDKALYVADTANGKIYRLKPGSQTPELFTEAQPLNGIDGITFLDGVLYVNNVSTSKLYRIPMDASGKAGAPVEIIPDTPLGRPDGMRAGSGKLFVAENGGGKVSALTIKGDTAHVEVLKADIRTPTGVEPVGDTLWFTERGTGKVWSMPIPK